MRIFLPVLLQQQVQAGYGGETDPLPKQTAGTAEEIKNTGGVICSTGILFTLITAGGEVAAMMMVFFDCTGWRGIQIFLRPKRMDASSLLLCCMYQIFFALLHERRFGAYQRKRWLDHRERWDCLHIIPVNPIYSLCFTAAYSCVCPSELRKFRVKTFRQNYTRN